MEDKLNKLWQLLRENYSDIPDYDVFSGKFLNDETVARNVHQLMLQDFSDTPKDFNVFYETFKKKSQESVTPQESPAGQQVSATAQQGVSQEQPKPVTRQGDGLIAIPLKPYSQQSLEEKKKINEYNRLLSEISAMGIDIKNAEKAEQSGVSFVNIPELGKEQARRDYAQKILRAKSMWEYFKQRGLVDGDIRFIENDPAREMGDAKQAIIHTSIAIKDALENSLIGKVAKIISEGGTDYVRMETSFLPGVEEEIAKEEQEKAEFEQRDLDYRQYHFGKLEQYATMAGSFLVDTPIFLALGGGASMLTSRATGAYVNTVARGLMKTGVSAEMAQAIAVKSLSNTAKGLAVRGVEASMQSGAVLGAYNALLTTAEQVENAENFSDISATEILNSAGHGALLGAGVGLISPLWAKASDMVSMGVENHLLRKAAKAGISVSEFGSEATMFAGISAAMDENQTFGTDLIVENGLMLLALKGANLPVKLAGMAKIGERKEMNFTDHELNLLGVTSKNDIRDLSQDKLVEIANNENIPLVTKYKLMTEISGLIPIGTLKADEVQVDNDIVRLYRNYNGKRELVSESKFDDNSSAKLYALNENKAIKDRQYKTLTDNFTVDQLAEYEKRLNEAEDVNAMMEAVNTPVEMRNNKQVKLANRWYNIVDEVSNKVESKEAEIGQKEAEISTNKTTPTENTVKEEIVENLAQNEPKIKSEEGKSDAETVRSDEGQVLQGEPQKGNEAQESLQQGAGEGGENLQQPAREKTFAKKVESLDDIITLEVENKKKIISDFISEKRGELQKMDDKLIPVFLREVNRATERTVNRVVDKMKKALENSQYAQSITRAGEAAKKLEDNIKGLDVKALKKVKVVGRITSNGSDVIAKVNRIKVTDLPEGIIDDYINTVGGLSKKIVTPDDVKQANEFLERYANAVKEKNLIDDAPEYKVEDIPVFMEEVLKNVDDLLAIGDFEAVRKADARLRTAERYLRRFVKDGVIDSNVQFIDNTETRIQEQMDAVMERMQTLKAESKEAVISANGQVVSSVKIDENLALSNGDYLEALSLKQTVEELKGLKESLYSLRESEISDLVEYINYYNETGVMPVGAYQLGARLRTLARYGKVAENVVTPVEEQVKNNPQLAAELDKNVTEFKKVFARNPQAAMGHILKLKKFIGETVVNPFYNYIQNPGRAAIKEYRTMLEKFMNPIYEAAKTRTWFEKGVYDTGGYDRKLSATVGILMPQVRMYNFIQKLDNRIVGVNGAYTVVDPFGNPYKDGDVIRKFRTKQDALAFAKMQPIDRLADGRSFDLFDVLNYDIKDGERVESSKRRDALITTDEKRHKADVKLFDEVYSELVKRNGGNDLSNIRTDEDALKLLTPEEKKLYNTLRENLKLTADINETIAAREGHVLAKEDYYYPMLSRSLRMNNADAESLLVTRMESGNLSVTNHIRPKTLSMNYIDFDAVRTMERYNRDVLQSYYVLPVAKEQLGALKMVRKTASNKAIYDSIEQDIRDGYKIEFTSKGMFGQVGITAGSKYYDASKAFRAIVQAARNYTLAKAERVVLDTTANMLKAGRLYTGDMSKWDVFFEKHYVGSAAPGGEGDVGFGRHAIEYSGFQRKAKMQKFTDELVAVGDTLPGRRIWISKFKEAFKESYGEEFDVEKFITDADYRLKVKSNSKWDEVVGVADSNYEQVMVPSTKYSNAKELNYYLFSLRSNTRAYQYNASMASYSINESAQFMAMLNNIKNGGVVVPKMVSRYILSNMAFNALTQIGVNASRYIGGMIADDESVKYDAIEAIKSLTDKEQLGANFFVSLISLATGRFANVGRITLGATYAGLSSVIRENMSKAEQFKYDAYEKSVFNNLGINRILPTDFDPTKTYTSWKDVTTIVGGWYGKGLLDYGEDLYKFPEQVKNYVMNATSEDQMLNEPFDFIQMTNGLSAWLSGAVPGMPNVKYATKAMSNYIGSIPYDYISDVATFKTFTLTALDAQEVFEKKYKQVKEYSEKRGQGKDFSMSMDKNARMKWNEPRQDVITDSWSAAQRMVEDYLEGEGLTNVYRFFNLPVIKENIVLVDAFINEIQKDKTLKPTERAEAYKLVREEAAKLERAFNSFEKGETEGYVISPELMNHKIMRKVYGMKEKILKSYGKMTILYE